MMLHTFCCSRAVNAEYGEFCYVLFMSMRRWSIQINVKDKTFINIRIKGLTKITAISFLWLSTWKLFSYSNTVSLTGADSFSESFTLFLLKITRAYVSQKGTQWLFSDADNSYKAIRLHGKNSLVWRPCWSRASLKVLFKASSLLA